MLSFAYKTVVWTVFASAILGLTLSAVLWTRKAREFIVETWYSVSSDLEHIFDHESYTMFYQGLLSSLLLNRRGSVSPIKTLGLALIGLCLAVIGSCDSKSWQQDIIDWLPRLPTAALIHWGAEYACARRFMRKYREYSGNNLSTRVVISTAESLIYLTALSLLLMFAIFPILMIFYGGTPETAPKYVLGFLLHGYNLSVVSAAHMAEEGAAPAFVLFFFFSICPTIIGALVWLVVTLTTRSRIFLNAVRHLCERLDSLTAAAVFSASMLLFALSTGLMQAHTF